jgi:hypothetical protein
MREMGGIGFKACWTTWPLSDNLQERMSTVEQKVTQLEAIQTALDRKYSELDVNDELLTQQVRNTLADVKQLLIRMDRAEHRLMDSDNDIVILKSS